VECLGQRLCEPCAHLERLTTKGVLRALIHRGGLRADVLTDGLISTGATIKTID
jgi:MOSC domain-containing protein YiiM